MFRPVDFMIHAKVTTKLTKISFMPSLSNSYDCHENNASSFHELRLLEYIWHENCKKEKSQWWGRIRCSIWENIVPIFCSKLQTCPTEPFLRLLSESNGIIKEEIFLSILWRIFQSPFLPGEQNIFYPQQCCLACLSNSQ